MAKGHGLADLRLRARTWKIARQLERVFGMRHRRRTSTLRPRDLREDDLRSRRLLLVPEGQQCVARLGRLLASRVLRLPPARGELEQQRGTIPVVGRPERERLPVETHRQRERAQRESAFARAAEREARALSKEGHVAAHGARQLERALVVLGEQLDVVVAILDQGSDPFRGEPVLLDPRATWDLPVGDIANEYVTERVLRLAGDRGAAPAPNELLALEAVQALLDGDSVAARHRRDRTCPEDLAVNRGGMEQLLLLNREAIESRGDDRLHRLRHRKLIRVGSLGEHARILLRVQRIPTRALDQRSVRLGIEHRAGESGGEQACRVLVRERPQRQGGRVRLATPPTRPPLEQLGAGGADNE